MRARAPFDCHEATRPDRLSVVVFDVAGYIDLASRIEMRGIRCLYIAGQTAPGGGITIRGADQTALHPKERGSVGHRVPLSATPARD